MPIQNNDFEIAPGFRAVTYVELYCSRDGCFRVGLERPLLDVEQFPCPACGEQRPAAVIGTGFTTHSDPIIEMVHSPLPGQEAERRQRGIPINRIGKACVRSLASVLR